MVGKFMTDPIWWFYLFWLPKFLHDSYGLTLSTVGLPLVTILLCRPTSAASSAAGCRPRLITKAGA